MAEVDLVDLRLLVLVAQVHSIGQVAEELGVPQPTVSRRLSRLERRWGLALLERSPRGTHLTSVGEVVVDWSAALLKRVDDFQLSLTSLRDSESATVRVAASMTMAEQYLPGWIRLVTQHEPEARISLEVRNSAEVTKLVESGAVELGFIESLFVSPNLESSQVGWDRLAVAVPPNHPWAAPGYVLTVEELSGTALLLREPGSGTRETLDEALRRFGLRPNPAVEMASNIALKSAALDGVGPAVLSKASFAREIAAAQLVAVEVSGVSLRRPLTAIWRDAAGLHPVGKLLLRIARGT